MKKMINEEQLRCMVRFMERYGDLRLCGDVRRREIIRKKWMQLVTKLNSQGEKKNLRQWVKVWTDYKYNTVKKYKRLLRGCAPELNENEKIVMMVLRDQRGSGNTTSGPDVFDINSTLGLSEPTIINVCNLCDQPVKEETTQDNGFFSHTFSDHELSNQELPEIITERIFCVLPNAKQRKDTESLSVNSSQSSTDRNKVEDRRRKSTDSDDKMTELADKFYELERERERMAHEREMARIQQHKEFLSVMSRLVNVVETLAPSLQRYMDRSMSGGG